MPKRHELAKDILQKAGGNSSGFLRSLESDYTMRNLKWRVEDRKHMLAQSRKHGTKIAITN